MEKVNNFLSGVKVRDVAKEKCDECNHAYGMKITITYADGTIKSSCKYCEDKKLVEQMNIPQSKEEREQLKLRDKAMHFTRIPDELIGVKLNDYIAETDEQRAAKEKAVDFIVNFDKTNSLVMSGDPGIGKTHIAVAILKALSQDNAVMFVKSTHLLDLIKESYGQASHSEMDVLNTCRDVDLLIIDDLGAEYTKESDNESWASDILFKVIDSRLGKSLIITTNYSESLLEQKYGFNGKRITSRMSDGAEKIRIVGKDRRKA